MSNIGRAEGREGELGRQTGKVTRRGFIFVTLLDLFTAT